MDHDFFLQSKDEGEEEEKTYIRCVILAARIRKLVDRVGSLFISALFETESNCQ